MSFLAPLALWGLLAGAVPLILHLRRRRVGRTIQVGSLRHLDTLPTAERRGHRLRDPIRLLLRLAVIAALVLSLADPALPHSGGSARPFVVVDLNAPTALVDSLRSIGQVSVEGIRDPWRRIQELDDSLPRGVPLLVGASASSDRYRGPRPTVARQVTWLPIEGRPVRPNSSPSTTQHTTPNTPTEFRALRAAVAATAEEFGPLTDSAGWIGRLPDWWRDSLATASFPLAVARAIAPGRATLRPVAIGEHQLLPRQESGGIGRENAPNLHWWPWAIALLLFLLERLWARRMQEEA